MPYVPPFPYPVWEEEPQERCCTECRYQGRIDITYAGSGFVEVLLWIALIVPGALYSRWRNNNAYHICPTCGSRDTVPSRDLGSQRRQNNATVGRQVV